VSVIRMSDLDLRDQRVLIREDLNVPIDDHGQITSTQRLDAPCRPSCGPRCRREGDGAVASGPAEGRRFDAESSLAPVAEWLARASSASRCGWWRIISTASKWPQGEVVLLENCRMNVGEGKDDETLSKKYAALCDIFVMDAFGTAHRAQASTHGVIKFAPIAAAGPLLCAELDALGKALEHPAHPLLAIVAGSKVSTKLTLLDNLIGKVDQLIVGGGIANTFIAAMGTRSAIRCTNPI
jgi:phosphoglycerate kinase